ncbi:MAG: hypothetical protein IPN90_13770 [Elusimicrobia bacterium]|nr:hypothetical protein [Elusimicrobiota bacterium]
MNRSRRTGSPFAPVGERKPADGYFVDRGRYVSGSGLREIPRWTNARRGALNAPQLLPPVPTFPAPVHGKSRAAFLAAPRWAPVESFPAGPVPPIASVGERKPADGYFVGRERYVSRSGLREIIAPDERPSRRIKRAATPASGSNVSRSGPTEKPRGQRPRPGCPGPALRGSTSRPAGHLWASPFLRARKLRMPLPCR